MSNGSASNTESLKNALALTIVSSSLSVVGAIVIFLTFLCYHDVRNTSRRFLLFPTAADFMTAAGYLTESLRYGVSHSFGVHESHNRSSYCPQKPVCVAQSFVTTYSTMCSLNWTVAIAVFFYVFQQPVLSKKLITPFHIICWGLPGIITLAALGSGALGTDHSNYSVSAGAWCWISGCLAHKENIIWMVCTGKGWEILTYISSAMLIIIYFYQRRIQPRHSLFDSANSKGGTFRQEDNNFFAVPLFLYLLRMWGTIRFFIAIYAYDDDRLTLSTFDSVLLYLQCIGSTGQAFCNFVVFCLLDKPVRQRMFRCCYSRHGYRELRDVPRYGAMETRFT